MVFVAMPKNAKASNGWLWCAIDLHPLPVIAIALIHYSFTPRAMAILDKAIVLPNGGVLTRTLTLVPSP